MPRAPSILDILPMKMTTPATTRLPDIVEELEEDQDLESQEDQHLKDIPELHELSEDDSLQSVESEQIDSIYNTQGMYLDSRFLIAFGNFLYWIIQYILINEFALLLRLFVAFYVLSCDYFSCASWEEIGHGVL